MEEDIERGSSEDDELEQEDSDEHVDAYQCEFCHHVYEDFDAVHSPSHKSVVDVRSPGSASRQPGPRIPWSPAMLTYAYASRAHGMQSTHVCLIPAVPGFLVLPVVFAVLPA